MSESDVNVILRRLDVIDEKLKDIPEHGRKIDRLQLAIAFVAGVAASAGGTSVLSLVVG